MSHGTERSDQLTGITILRSTPVSSPSLKPEGDGAATSGRLRDMFGKAPTSAAGKSLKHALDKEQSDICFGVYLPEDYPLMPLSVVIESLRLANWIEEAEHFTYILISETGNPVQSSCSFPAPVSYSISNHPKVDILLVCAGESSVKLRSKPVCSWLRQIYRNGAPVGGISSGAFLLAQAGLLDGRTCAVHWETVDAMRDAFHRVTVLGDIFCLDERIITCAGGISTLDFMLHLVAQFRDWHFARKLADHLIYPSVRGAHEPARISLRARTGVSNATLLRAIKLMESNLETPVKVNDISKELGTSARHLERLFARVLRTSPSQYYMRLRLREARGLLAQTDIPVLEVALRCGFSSASHFTRRYREVYQVPPREQRSSQG